MSSILDSVFTVNIVQVNERSIQMNDVVAVRIVSKDYNLLIMKDYMPIIGEVEGVVDVLGKEMSCKLENGVAYFTNNNNVFTLIVKNGAIKKSETQDELAILEKVVA